MRTHLFRLSRNRPCNEIALPYMHASKLIYRLDIAFLTLRLGFTSFLRSGV